MDQKGTYQVDQFPVLFGRGTACHQNRFCLELLPHSIASGKYHSDRIVAPRSWYFTLDGKEGKRYTISVDKETISITEGKPASGKADCVIKTTSSMLSRMILEGYVPSMTEFASGKVKTNAPNLLFEFQKVFQLKEDT